MKRKFGYGFLAALLLLFFAVEAFPSDKQQEGLEMQVMEKSREVEGHSNVREKPGLKSKVVFEIPRHPEDSELRGVTVYEQKGEWFKVELSNGKKGWMHTSVLGCFAAEDTVLYSKPNKKSVTKIKVPTETPLFLTGIKGSWAKIAYTDKKGKKTEGWLPSESRTLDYEF